MSAPQDVGTAVDGAELRLRVGLCAAAALALLAGWALFFFLCDDAYIAFRYVSNSRLGYGYTWNPPPFLPVEGYTSFLWVVLLDAVWRLFGVEPPQASNLLSLLFSAGSLALVVAMVLRLRLAPETPRLRTALLGLVLLGTLSNRTFLAWTSSGLETALFGCLLLAWVALGIFGSRGPRGLFCLSLAAGLLALARPDGLLYAAATAGLLGFHAFARGKPSPRALLPALPLLIPVAHVLWRRARYGFWVPNTYYAKATEAWPEAGVRYLAAFLVEYAYWVWVALALVAGLRALRGGGLFAKLRAWEPGAVAALVVSGTLLLHFAYYTFLVGGDHFEFRVYQHLVPLVLVSFAPLARAAGLSPRRTLAALAAMIVLGWPLPWVHWWYTHGIVSRGHTFMLHYEVAPHFPAPLRPYAAAWDRLQGWLTDHFVGLRHQEHKIFAEVQLQRFPTRERGSQIGGEGHPVMTYHTVGVPGWVLPHVAIIDYFGLNDVVVAHSKPLAETGGERMMAHDRAPPKGYLDCFRPNITVSKEFTITVRRRKRELTAEEIRDCETRFRAEVSS
jgi:arabinofuranosyltransferase